MVQDGPEPGDYIVREVTGEERELWWRRSVEVFAPYAEYEVRAAEANRIIPVYIAEPSG
jgi:hypothetical protein